MNQDAGDTNSATYASTISDSHDMLFPVPCVGYFTSPGIGTREKGPTAFSISSERHIYVGGGGSKQKAIVQ